VDYYTQFASNYARQIKQAQEADEMKQYDPEIVAFVMMGISNFIGLNYIMFKDEKNVDQVVDEVIRILKDGLFT
jgi:predicted alternative tryptophan synthase beta-subunit